MKGPKSLKMTLGGILLIIVFAVGFATGQAGRGIAVLGAPDITGIGDISRNAADVDFRLYWDVWRMLQQDYLKGPVEDADLFYASLEGLVNGLGDQHSVFFDPEFAAEFARDLAGAFDGIGAEIGKRDGQIIVIAPLADSPAEAAGVKAGDAIFKINELETEGMSVEEAVKNIRGQKGTTVTLTVAHPNAEAVVEVPIVRETIKISSVKWEMGQDGVATISLRFFNNDTAREMNKAVVDLLPKNPQGIVLDLRNNPGGLLDRAVTIAGEWAGPQNIVSERDKDGRIEEFPASGVARFAGIKTVALVNGGSASATEILAGALQDYGLVTVVGTQTYGKGSVQEYRTLEDGSALKITVAEWLTPKGRSIEGQGIMPDEIVEVTDLDVEAKRDPQMERARDILKQGPPAERAGNKETGN